MALTCQITVSETLDSSANSRAEGYLTAKWLGKSEGPQLYQSVHGAGRGHLVQLHRWDADVVMPARDWAGHAADTNPNCNM